MSKLIQENPSYSYNNNKVIITGKKPKKPSRDERKSCKSKYNSNVSSCTKNKAALKVVYISNPMRVEVRATEFQALVQELTGRDSAVWPDQEGKITNMSLDVINNIGNQVPTAAALELPDLGLFEQLDCDLGEVDDKMFDMEDYSSFFD